MTVDRDRDIEIWKLYCAGHKQQAIAKRFGVSQPTVVRAIQRVKDSIPKEDKQELIRREVALLDRIRAEMMDDFEARLPPAFNQAGRPLVDPETGEIVRDRSSRYAALDRVLRAQAEYRKLLGLDEATKVDANVQQVTYVLLGVDDQALQ